MNKRVRLPLMFFLAVLVSVCALAQEKPTCAVLTIKGGIGISADEAKFVSDRLNALLKQEGRYNLVERPRMPRLFALAGLDGELVCETLKQAVEAGRALSAKYVIFGQASHLGKLYSLSTSLVDVEKAIVQHTALADRKGDITDFSEFAPAVNLTSLLALTRQPAGWPALEAKPDVALAPTSGTPAVKPPPAARLAPPSRSLNLDAAGNPKLVIKNVQRGRDGKYIALIEGIGVVKAGSVVRVKKGGHTYTWRITSITEKGVSHTKVRITPPAEK